jgi:hypothetical protein
MKRITLIVISILASLTVYSCSAPVSTTEQSQSPKASATTDEASLPPSHSPSPSPSPSPFVIPEPVLYEGYGDSVIAIEPPEGAYVFYIEGNAASRHFAVKGYDASGDATKLLVNTTDPYKGTTIELTLTTTTLEINADDSWSIELRSIYEMPIISKGETITGTGDTIILVKSYGTTATIDGNAASRHFAVKSYGAEQDNLMVNTTDPYSGTVMLKGAPVILEITCDDDWSITF